MVVEALPVGAIAYMIPTEDGAPVAILSGQWGTATAVAGSEGAYNALENHHHQPGPRPRAHLRRVS